METPASVGGHQTAREAATSEMATSALLSTTERTCHYPHAQDWSADENSCVQNSARYSERNTSSFSMPEMTSPGNQSPRRFTRP